jgi:hypothetical protein
MVAAVTGFPARSRRRPHGGPAASRRYERRRPEKTPLHKIVSENLESWLEWREAAERPVPGYVEDELRGYLECGLLCFGFARAVCMTCRTGLVVAFSCKGRGVCPSCNGRHELAAERKFRPVGMPRQPALTIPRDRLAVGDELHHEMRQRLAVKRMAAGGVDRGDAGMPQAAEQLGLELEPPQPRRRHGAGPHHLDGDLPRRPQLTAPVDPTHPPCPDDSLDPHVANDGIEERIGCRGRPAFVRPDCGSCGGVSRRFHAAISEATHRASSDPACGNATARGEWLAAAAVAFLATVAN